MVSRGDSDFPAPERRIADESVGPQQDKYLICPGEEKRSNIANSFKRQPSSIPRLKESRGK